MATNKINPHLADLFKTALASASPTPSAPIPPRIVVNGTGNVVSLGGPVFVQQPALPLFAAARKARR